MIDRLATFVLDLRYVRVESAFDSQRSAPRFMALLEDAGFGRDMAGEAFSE